MLGTSTDVHASHIVWFVHVVPGIIVLDGIFNRPRPFPAEMTRPRIMHLAHGNLVLRRRLMHLAHGNLVLRRRLMHLAHGNLVVRRRLVKIDSVLLLNHLVLVRFRLIGILHLRFLQNAPLHRFLFPLELQLHRFLSLLHVQHRFLHLFQLLRMRVRLRLLRLRLLRLRLFRLRLRLRLFRLRLFRLRLLRLRLRIRLLRLIRLLRRQRLLIRIGGAHALPAPAAPRTLPVRVHHFRRVGEKSGPIHGRGCGGCGGGRNECVPYLGQNPQEEDGSPQENVKLSRCLGYLEHFAKCLCLGAPRRTWSVAVEGDSVGEPIIRGLEGH